MSDLENAIGCMLNPSCEEGIKKQAEAFFNNLKAQSGFYQYAAQLYATCAAPEVRFVLLLAISEHVSSDKCDAKDTEWVRQWCTYWMQNEVAKRTSEPIFLRNKYAQVMVQVFVKEYLERWTTFFPELLQTLSHGKENVDFFLRVMDTIDEFCVSNEFQRSPAENARNTHIKDAMRMQCLADVVEAWYTILVNYSAHPTVLCDCMANIAKYISWIDISLIANDKFLPILFRFMGHKDLGEATCGCLLEVMAKKMDAASKVAHIQRLQIVDFSLQSASADEEMEPKFAELVCAICCELLFCMEKLGEQQSSPEVVAVAEQQLTKLMPLYLRLLTNEDDDISSAALQFAATYVSRVKKLGTALTDPTLGQILRAVAEKTKYDVESYDFDREDQQEAEFQQFRKELATIFKNITRLNSKLAIDLVAELLAASLPRVDTGMPAFADLEMALSLLWHLGESVLESEYLDPSGPFPAMIVSIVNSNVSSFPHRAVAIAYFETVVRFYKILVAAPEHLPVVLTAFFDQRGLRHGDVQVRSRAAYLFLRFVKLARDNMTVYMEQLTSALKGFLKVDVETGLSFEDGLNLWEAAGVIIGTQINEPLLYNFFDEQVRPRLAEMDALVQSGNASQDGIGVPECTLRFAQNVQMLGYLSKGLQPLTDGAGDKLRVELFGLATERVLHAAVTFPRNPELQKEVLFFMHRMVECLGEHLLPLLPAAVASLLRLSESQMLVDFMVLLNQLMIKFKTAMFAQVNEMFLGMVDKIFATINSLSATPAAHADGATGTLEVTRETLELHKTFYQFVHTAICSDLTPVFVSAENLGRLNSLLSTIIHGCVEISEPQVQKVCFVIFNKLCTAWSGDTGFQTFMRDQVLNACFQCALHPNFNLQDAATMQVLQEIVTLQKAVYRHCGAQEVSSQLATVLLPSLACGSADVVTQYLHHLQYSDTKQFRSFFKELMIVARRLRASSPS